MLNLSSTVVTSQLDLVPEMGIEEAKTFLRHRKHGTNCGAPSLIS